MQGVYLVKNTLTGFAYVGSSSDVRGRFAAHRRALRAGAHYNKDLQAAWDQDGESAFSFELVRPVSDGSLLERSERDVLATMQNLYNRQMPTDDKTAWCHSDVSKALISRAASRLWTEDTYLANIAPRLAQLQQIKHVHEQYRRIRGRLAYLKHHILKTHLSYGGRTQSKSAWAAELGVTQETLRERIRRAEGDLSRVLGPYTVPGKPCLYPKIPNETMLRVGQTVDTLRAWAAQAGLRPETVYARLQRGWTPEEAIKPGSFKNLPKLHAFRGERASVQEIASQLGVKPAAVRYALKIGKPLDDLLVARSSSGKRPKSARGRPAVLVDVDGIALSLPAWAERFNMKYNRLRYVLGNDPTRRVNKLRELEAIRRISNPAR